MRRKRVLLIEDEALQRETLREQLGWRGFEVESAANAARARAIVESSDEPFDVVILDMHLEGSDVTGADLGIEFRKRWRKWSPEFLINSAYTRAEYLKLAVELGVAAYLDKAAKADTREAIRYVRALALKHALSVERPDSLEITRAIAMSSRDGREAVYRFCNELLKKELENCLGAPFLLLVTEGTWVEPIGSGGELPANSWSSNYLTIQALVYGRGGNVDPLVLDENLIPPEKGAIPEVLKNAVFIPLASHEDLRLSLGILPPDESQKLTEDPIGLAHVLGRHFQPAVLEHLLMLTVMLAELNERRLTMLKATSQFCLYVGQEQITTLNAAQDVGEFLEMGTYLDKVYQLAEDLRHTGFILDNLARAQEPYRGVAQEKPTQTVSMRNIVSSAWEKVVRLLNLSEKSLLSLDAGDCRVVGSPVYLEIAASRILQWFAQRLAHAPDNVRPSIQVQFAGDGLEVVFVDHSRKIADNLRSHLFMPFSEALSQPPARSELGGPGLNMPLYMAKSLVEFGNGGRLDDRSADIIGDFGHKLVMSFPESLAA
jgi:CheY-like chemotaxis protein